MKNTIYSKKMKYDKIDHSLNYILSDDRVLEGKNIGNKLTIAHEQQEADSNIHTLYITSDIGDFRVTARRYQQQYNNKSIDTLRVIDAFMLNSK